MWREREREREEEEEERIEKRKVGRLIDPNSPRTYKQNLPRLLLDVYVVSVFVD